MEIFNEIDEVPDLPQGTSEQLRGNREFTLENLLNTSYTDIHEGRARTVYSRSKFFIPNASFIRKKDTLFVKSPINTTDLTDLINPDVFPGTIITPLEVGEYLRISSHRFTKSDFPLAGGSNYTKRFRRFPDEFVSNIWFSIKICNCHSRTYFHICADKIGNDQVNPEPWKDRTCTTETSDPCCICYDEIEGLAYKKNGCSCIGVFCAECTKMWFDSHEMCPYCRG